MFSDGSRTIRPLDRKVVVVAVVVVATTYAWFSGNARDQF